MKVNYINNEEAVIIALAIVFLILICYGISKIIDNKYKNFVNTYSKGIDDLKKLNDKYIFKKIPDCKLSRPYDNKKFYTDISCKDYLTYQLIYKQKKIKEGLNDALENNALYEDYKSKINSIELGRFFTKNILKNNKKLLKTEKEEFKKIIKTPKIEYTIIVKLILTNIHGRYITMKSQVFQSKEIRGIMYKLNQKRNGFYLDPEIWQSICRVERGRVTNKIRFEVYKKDNFRCRRCGSPYNLEVDHIIPIAKGGKSDISNLQTLCHRCNCEKSDKLDW